MPHTKKHGREVNFLGRNPAQRIGVVPIGITPVDPKFIFRLPRQLKRVLPRRTRNPVP